MPPKTSMTADAEREQRAGDLHALAVLLNEIRQAWRPLDEEGRDSLRKTIIDAVRRFRAQRMPGAPDCPWDTSSLADEPPERLLYLLRAARFNEARLQDQLDRTRSGTDEQQQDLKATVARCAALIRRDRKTVPMSELKAAVWPGMEP